MASRILNIFSRRAGRVALLVAAGLAAVVTPTTAQTGYSYDYDYAGQGDDWYGRPGPPDPRRDYDASAVDLASAGDDFGFGYDYGADILDKLAPLALTRQRHSEYAFRFGSLGTFTHSSPGRVTQLSLDKLPGVDILLSWAPSCAVTDTDYEIYRATIPNFTSHTPLQCSTGGNTFATITPPLGSSLFYLIVPTNKARDGSFGSRTSGERPVPPITCLIAEPGLCN